MIENIEEIVGVPRDPVDHIARAVTEEEVVYILHSSVCEDIYTCEYTEALDRGIDLNIWQHYADTPIAVEVVDGWLTPRD